MAKQELTCDDILKELRAKQYRPVYYLMGEEDYYIDLIAGYIESTRRWCTGPMWTLPPSSMRPSVIR